MFACCLTLQAFVSGVECDDGTSSPSPSLSWSLSLDLDSDEILAYAHAPHLNLHYLQNQPFSQSNASADFSKVPQKNKVEGNTHLKSDIYIYIL